MTTESNNLFASIAYNGTVMSKQELMAYLATIVRLKREIDEATADNMRLYEQNQALFLEAQRRPVPIEIRLKPTGLAALSGKKRREYQRWLDEAPQREMEQKCKEQEEDARIAQIRENIRKNSEDMQVTTCQVIKPMADQYCELLQQQIIPPDYRKNGIPEILLMYLFNSRAQTLTEAINLYHEELHRGKMLEVAEKQRQQAEEAQKRMQWLANQQMEIQRQQMEIQSEHMAALHEEARKARKELESIRYYQELDFLSNL